MMSISKRSAQQIVEEMRGIIKHHINMMDQTGTIIASTDPQRIGTYHKVAQQVINQRLPVLMVYKDNEYDGIRRGINLPLVIEDDYIGVVGITGEPEQVKDYGKIIQHMTKILLMENYTREQRRIAEQSRNQFLVEWLFEPVNAQDNAFVQRGKSLGIHIRIPRRVMLVRAISPAGKEALEQSALNQIEETVKKIIIEEPDCHFLRMSSFFGCLVTKRDNDEMEILARKVIDAIGRYGASAAIGIDFWQPGNVSIQTGYARAFKALRTCEDSGATAITFYDSLTTEIFLSEISYGSKREFISRVFYNCPEESIGEYVKLLEVYYACNGSLIHTAEKLYIHKNTLQQKLNKLSIQTGFDPRSYKDATLYMLAIQLYKDLLDLGEF